MEDIWRCLVVEILHTSCFLRCNVQSSMRCHAYGSTRGGIWDLGMSTIPIYQCKLVAVIAANVYAYPDS
jgi:hypothetical protein